MISLVIPVYNDRAGYLRDCLTSVAAQTHNNWEALVIDDGSADVLCVAETIRSFQDPRMRVIRHERNRGLSAARNTGIAAARGTFVAMVDSDDTIEPQFLAETSQALVESPECFAAYGNFRLFGMRNEPLEFLPSAKEGTRRVRRLRTALEQHFIRHEPGAEDRLWQAPAEKLEAGLYLRFVLPPGAGVLLRRDAIQQFGGYSEEAELKLGLEDWDYWLGAAEADVAVVHIARQLYCYRQHAASLVSRVGLYEHQIREVMVRRHEPLLRHLGLRDKVLAGGYRRSARAAAYAGQPLTAARLGFRALRLDPGAFIHAAAKRRELILSFLSGRGRRGVLTASAK